MNTVSVVSFPPVSFNWSDVLIFLSSYESYELHSAVMRNCDYTKVCQHQHERSIFNVYTCSHFLQSHPVLNKVQFDMTSKCMPLDKVKFIYSPQNRVLNWDWIEIYNPGIWRKNLQFAKASNSECLTNCSLVKLGRIQSSVDERKMRGAICISCPVSRKLLLNRIMAWYLEATVKNALKISYFLSIKSFKN